ncbi:MAG: 6-phosphogluconolactonase [Phycisphaerae bacterium]|nr:6-phosphogluconolactonase [Phycisphaerae bacterium]
MAEPTPHGRDTYDLDEVTPLTPALPGLVSVARTRDQLLDAVAADLIVHAKNCVRTFGDVHIALSGGSTPLPLYERLMYDPNLRSFPWTRTHLWIVDERCVPFDDSRSNFGHIKDIVVDHSGIPTEQVHPMMATHPDADALYENELREHLGWREKGQDRLDWVVLGMGDDGHTASLFPHHEALDETVRLVRKCTGPFVTPPDRVTMTYPLINSARFIAIMVTGAAKAPTIARIARGNPDPHELPITAIRPLAGELKWYLDADAAVSPITL